MARVSEPAGSSDGVVMAGLLVVVGGLVHVGVAALVVPVADGLAWRLFAAVVPAACSGGVVGLLAGTDDGRGFLAAWLGFGLSLPVVFALPPGTATPAGLDAVVLLAALPGVLLGVGVLPAVIGRASASRAARLGPPVVTALSTLRDRTGLGVARAPGTVQYLTATVAAALGLGLVAVALTPRVGVVAGALGGALLLTAAFAVGVGRRRRAVGSGR